MNLHLLDKIVPKEDLFTKKPVKDQEKTGSKLQKKLQKEAKKAEKARKKAEKAKQKELKKKAKQQLIGDHTDGNTINLVQRTTETLLTKSQQTTSNIETASFPVSTALLLGGALLLVAASALFYRKKQGQY